MDEEEEDEDVGVGGKDGKMEEGKNVRPSSTNSGTQKKKKGELSAFLERAKLRNEYSSLRSSRSRYYVSLEHFCRGKEKISSPPAGQCSFSICVSKYVCERVSKGLLAASC